VSKAISKLDTSKFIYHKLSAEQVIKSLKTDLKVGLTNTEVENRIKEHGLNELEAEEPESLWSKILE
jgi:magnesium-transporting ATPase (P-type)